MGACVDGYDSVPLIDVSALEQWTSDLEPEDVADILAQVPAQCGGCVRDLEAAVDAAQLAQAKRVAHKLKGMAANLGASRLAKIARSVELDAQDMEDVAGRLASLKSTVADTIEALQRLN